MAEQEYVLEQSERAARRLAIQDAHFAEVSERLLDELKVRPTDRVVELGCGPGGLSRRILKRLGAGGVLVGVDASEGLLRQAEKELGTLGPGRFHAVRADIAAPGDWLEGADVLLGRTVLHHVPMVEFVLGRYRTMLRPGTRVGFLEPDFRIPLTRLGHLEASARPELEPLRMWAIAINQLYQLSRLSPDIGAILGRTLELGGYRNVRESWSASRSDKLMLDNMLMFYDEVRGRLEALSIMTAAEVDRQQTLLRNLKEENLPGVWGIHLVTCEA